MAFADLGKKYWRDESGAVMVEMTVTIFMFLVILFGVVEFAYAYYQWNAATKATQLGARLAAVSTPVASNLVGLTDVLSGYNPGETLPTSTVQYDFVCDGSLATPSCSCSGSLCPAGALTYNSAAMRALVYGREATTNACPAVADKNNIGMCHIFTRISYKNVKVEYRYTGLGYVGRPGGSVPTVTVQITGMQFQFVLLSMLGFTSIDIPGLATTVTGEDLSLAAPTY